MKGQFLGSFSPDFFFLWSSVVVCEDVHSFATPFLKFESLLRIYIGMYEKTDR